MYPSIRDQEYLQHSSLWGNQYISGGAGDGNQILGPGLKMSKQEIKTDSSLPAYCNPPNPCPVDYTEEQGCMEDFENTATFSRNYQALQDCMCDTEHMFDCPSAGNPLVDDQMDFSRLLQQSLKVIFFSDCFMKILTNHTFSRIWRQILFWLVKNCQWQPRKATTCFKYKRRRINQCKFIYQPFGI